MKKFIVVCYYPADFNEMNCPNNWFKTFDEKEEALDYFHTEENRFNIKKIIRLHKWNPTKILRRLVLLR